MIKGKERGRFESSIAEVGSGPVDALRPCSRKCTCAPTTRCRRFPCRSRRGSRRRHPRMAVHEPRVSAAPAVVGRFRDYLRRHRLPVTRQRDLIAGALARTDGLSIGRRAGADPPARAASRSGRPPSIGRSSSWSRRARARVGLWRPGPPLRGGAGQPAHGHLVCRRCGRVIEFSSDLLERMMPVLADEHGFMHEEHRIEDSRDLPVPTARSADMGEPVTFGVLVAFSAGLLSFLSPCVLPLVPSYIGFLTGMTLRAPQSPSHRRAARALLRARLHPRLPGPRRRRIGFGGALKYYKPIIARSAVCSSCSSAWDAWA